MNGMLKNKIAACVLVLIVVTVGVIFAADVTVQQGFTTMDTGICVGPVGNPYLFTYYGNLQINAETELNNIFTVNNSSYNPILKVDPYSYPYVEINSDMEVSGSLYTTMLDAYYIGYQESPRAWLLDTYVNGDLSVGGYTYLYDTEIDSDLNVFGIVYADDFVQNSYASSIYEQKSRSEIIEQVQKELPPDKQNAAAMFFNKETKKIENYVASEGKFYDMQGNVIHELAEVVKPTTKYETTYSFDKTTGQIRSTQRAVADEYQIKKEYSLDRKTGNFINKDTGQVVSREEALEIYVASEGKIYDLNHNYLRDSDKKKTTEIAAAGNFDSSKSQIKTAQNNTENQETTVKPASSTR